MPVQTRSQTARSKLIRTVNVEDFVKEIKYLLYLCDEVVDRNSRMIICLEIFKKINQELPVLIERKTDTVWLKFASIICNKANEMQVKLHTDWVRYDKSLVKKFVKELYQARRLALSILEDNSIF